MPTGRIKSKVEDRGFGFIETATPGKDVFFHVSGVANNGFPDLAVGDQVSYDLDPGRNDKGPRAINVKAA